MTPYNKNTGGKYFKILAHLGALFTVSAWGSSFIFSKVLMEDADMTPVEVYIYRFALAYIILLLFTFRQIRSKSWRDELQFVICGICAGSLYFITENYALEYTTTGNVSLLSSMSPIFTTILMALVFRNRIGLGVIIGSIAAVIGVGFVVFSKGGSLEFNPLGDLLALSSALSWAIYSIVVKRLTPIYTTAFISRKLFFYGVISAVPLLLLQKEPLHLTILLGRDHLLYLGCFLFLVLICSTAAYLIWNESLKKLGAVTTNNYLYLQPLATLIIAYFWFGETITPMGYIGCALIIGGLITADKLTFNKKFKS